MNKRELRKSLPAGPRIPPAMQMLATWVRPSSTLHHLRRRYGKRITVQLPFQPPFVILSDPDEIKQLFTAPPEAIHPGEGARILEPIVGSFSLILLDEGPHLEHRRLLLPAFHGERMQRLAGLMGELTERELDSWPTEQPVALHPYLQHLTLEIILRAVFGLEQGARLDDLRSTLTEVLSFADSPLSLMPWMQRFERFIPTVRRFKQLTARTDELIFAQVQERRAMMHAGEDDHDDVLSMLLTARHEDESEMSDQEIRDELMTALVAGHETTASQLAWAFTHLAREPRIVGELTAELDRGESDAYLTATITEILRLRPVLPNAEPRLTKQPYKIGEIEYPAGVALLASAYLVHHDPDIYPEPFAFRPERFLDTQPGTYTWLPFGGGRRRCLGASFAQQEMKIVLAAVLRRFEFAAGGDAPEVTARRSITFSPSRGATVVLHKRPVSGYLYDDGSAGTDQEVRPLPAAAALAGSTGSGT
jgi:cytochrome P450